MLDDCRLRRVRASAPRSCSVFERIESNESVCLRPGVQCGARCGCSVRAGPRAQAPPPDRPPRRRRRHRAEARGPAGTGTQPCATGPGSRAELKPRFQEGMKYAYVNVQAVAADSAEGKVAAEKIKVLQEQKSRELQEKNKALQSAQQKLEQGGSVLSDQARAQLQAEHRASAARPAALHRRRAAGRAAARRTGRGRIQPQADPRHRQGRQAEAACTSFSTRHRAD